ncbi:hypothetical protein AB4037_33985 [Labrys sp. KB_33_2]
MRERRQFGHWECDLIQFQRKFGNRRACRWLSREIDPLSLDEQHLRQLCHYFNSTPRKCLGFRTPAEVFRRKLMAARR